MFRQQHQEQNPTSKNIVIVGFHFVIDGSSTVFLISHEAARRYQQKFADAPAVAVSFSGTGGGFQKFCAGETDINDASGPINSEEMKTCKRERNKQNIPKVIVGHNLRLQDYPKFC